MGGGKGGGGSNMMAAMMQNAGYDMTWLNGGGETPQTTPTTPSSPSFGGNGSGDNQSQSYGQQTGASGSFSSGGGSDNKAIARTGLSTVASLAASAIGGPAFGQAVGYGLNRSLSEGWMGDAFGMRTDEAKLDAMENKGYSRTDSYLSNKHGTIDTFLGTEEDSLGSAGGGGNDDGGYGSPGSAGDVGGGGYGGDLW